MRPGRFWVIALAVLGGLAAAAGGQGAPVQGQPALAAKLREIAAAHHGHVALFAENLRTGETVGLDADRPVQTASVIKVAILFDAMEQVRAGRVRLEEPVVLHKGEAVSGSGILQRFDAPLTLTLKDVLMLMMTQSDNTATNLAIDRLGRAAVDDELGAMELRSTWLYKKVFTPATEPMPADQPVFGLGKTTPREMARLLERIDRCEFVRPRAPGVKAPGDEELCGLMLTLLRQQAYRDGLPRLLPAKDTAEIDAAVGNKTGALDAVRNDVGIVSSKAGTLVLSLFTYGNADQSWSADTEAELTLAKLARAIVEAWSPAGLDAGEYRVHAKAEAR